MTTAIPTPPSWVTGDQPTATELNQLADSLRFWADPPASLVYRSTNQSIPHAVWTFVQWNGQVVDATESMHSVSYANSKVFINTTGRYQITGQLTFAANATGIRGAEVKANSYGDINTGSALFIGWNDANAAASGITSIPIPVMTRDLVAGDILETWAYQGSGVSLNLQPGNVFTYLAVRLIGS